MEIGGVGQPDLFGARRGRGVPAGRALDDLAHAVEPPAGAAEPLFPRIGLPGDDAVVEIQAQLGGSLRTRFPRQDLRLTVDYRVRNCIFIHFHGDILKPPI